MKTYTIAVGSLNPVKVQAVEDAFALVFPEFKILSKGTEVSSGVSDQPMSDEESIRGAKKRAKDARDVCDADFGVGIEGGLQKTDGLWFDTGWIVVVDKKGNEGIGSTIKMEVPEKILEEIYKGKELGEVIDLVFGTDNAKQKEGHFGLMTKNAITRTSAYKDGVVAALVRFIHPHLFIK
ncbi:MAG: inosine/xanthosine triphosphatase [Patescibacteria group bacterium]